MEDKILLVAITTLITFASSWGAAKFQLNDLYSKMKSMESRHETAIQLLHDRITKSNDKRDELRDMIHAMVVKVAEIHTIVTNLKK